MTWLVLGLFPEGPTDSRFLTRVIHREITSKLLYRGTRSVEVQEEIIIFDEKTNDARAEKICENCNSIDLFFVHADSSRASFSRIEASIINAIKARSFSICGFRQTDVVSLITVKEMEAWALADPDAIARACGYVQWPNNIAPPWRPSESESIDDPKIFLNDVVSLLYGGRRSRRTVRAAEVLDALGEEVDIERLRALSSYTRFTSELDTALRARNLI